MRTSRPPRPAHPDARTPVVSVPANAPGRAVARHAGEIRGAIDRVLASGCYVGGAEVRDFEREFAAYLGTARAVGTGSGTGALELALRSCGVGPGDRVATVSLTAVATVAAIELVGATPVLLDVEPGRLTLCPERLERLLARGPVRAVVPVHLYGQPADMTRIVEVADRHGAVVVEDCAQAHGASIGGRRCGTWGAMGAFSFYPTKNLGALGDGGAVTTRDPVLADRAARLREYGWRERNSSEEPGMNTRLDPLQAAVLRTRLPRLDAANARRREIAGRYDEALQGGTASAPARVPGETHVYHQYVVRTAGRDGLRARLERRGIGTAVHYPHPVHLQPAYRGRVPVDAGGLAETERACREVLSLPCFPELTDAEVAAVAEALLREAGPRPPSSTPGNPARRA